MGVDTDSEAMGAEGIIAVTDPEVRQTTKGISTLTVAQKTVSKFPDFDIIAL